MLSVPFDSFLKKESSNQCWINNGTATNDLQAYCLPKGSVKCNAENFYQKIIISISNLINYFKERVSIQKIIYPLHIRRNFLRIFQVIVLFEKNVTKGFCPVCFYACNKQSAELRT